LRELKIGNSYRFPIQQGFSGKRFHSRRDHEEQSCSAVIGSRYTGSDDWCKNDGGQETYPTKDIIENAVKSAGHTTQ
jgi:hypothetical protein